jgi:hypothetical protein
MAVISGCSEKCDGNSLGNGERPYNNHKKYKKFFPLETEKTLITMFFSPFPGGNNFLFFL